jgi:hypothetical protein
MPFNYRDLYQTAQQGPGMGFAPGVPLDPRQVDDRRGQGLPNGLQEYFGAWGRILDHYRRPRQQYPGLLGEPRPATDYGDYWHAEEAPFPYTTRLNQDPWR